MCRTRVPAGGHIGGIQAPGVEASCRIAAVMDRIDLQKSGSLFVPVGKCPDGNLVFQEASGFGPGPAFPVHAFSLMGKKTVHRCRAYGIEQSLLLMTNGPMLMPFQGSKVHGNHGDQPLPAGIVPHGPQFPKEREEGKVSGKDGDVGPSGGGMAGWATPPSDVSGNTRSGW